MGIYSGWWVIYCAFFVGFIGVYHLAYKWGDGEGRGGSRSGMVGAHCLFCSWVSFLRDGCNYCYYYCCIRRIHIGCSTLNYWDDALDGGLWKGHTTSQPAKLTLRRGEIVTNLFESKPLPTHWEYHFPLYESLVLVLVVEGVIVVDIVRWAAELPSSGIVFLQPTPSSSSYLISHTHSIIQSHIAFAFTYLH